MGNPASVLVISSAIAVLVVLALHGLVAKAAPHRRPGRLARLVEAIVGKLILAVYLLIGLTAILAFIIWIFSDHTPPVPPETAWTPKQAFATIFRYTKVRADSQDNAAKVLEGIRSDTRELERLSQTYTIPPEYLLQLSADAWQVRRYRKNRGLPDELLQSAARDLRDKRLYASKNPMNPFGSVLVKVATRNGHGDEVPGLEVRYCLKGIRPYRDRQHSFERWSSPTAKQLPPGNYLIWVRRPDYMLWRDRSEATEVGKDVDVGADGASGLNLDLVTQT